MTLRVNFFLLFLLINSSLLAFPIYAQDNLQGTSSGASIETSSTNASNTSKKKKVLVLTTSGGGGHMAASQAVRESLEDRYEVTTMDMIGQFSILENGARIFDHCFSNQKWNLMKLILAQPKFLGEDVAVLFCQPKMIRLLAQEKPDLIVSVLPTANYVYLYEAKVLGIPMIVIPTDFTATEFFHKIRDLGNSPELTIVLPFEEPKTIEYLNKRKLNNLVFDGYPVRRIFAEVGNKMKQGDLELDQELNDYSRAQFQLDRGRGDKAVFLSMGARGFGGKLIQQYAEAFLAHGHKVLGTSLSSQAAHIHLLIACGSNQELLHKLEDLQNHQVQNGDVSSRVHLHPLGWMSGDQMAKTVAISDVVITKPGGSTVAETIALGRYMLLLPDSTDALRWEKANLDLVVSHHWGEVLNRISKKNKDVDAVMTQIQEALEAVPAAFPENHFREKFAVTVDALLADSVR